MNKKETDMDNEETNEVETNREWIERLTGAPCRPLEESEDARLRHAIYKKAKIGSHRSWTRKEWLDEIARSLIQGGFPESFAYPDPVVLAESEPWCGAFQRLVELQAPPPGVPCCLHGPRGLGKTSMATTLAKALWSEDGPMGAWEQYRYVTMRQLFTKVVNDGLDLRNFIDRKLVVVDEVTSMDKERVAVTEMIEELVDASYARGRRLVLISPLTMDEADGGSGEKALTLCFGASACQRISQKKGWIKCDWETFRKPEPCGGG